MAARQDDALRREVAHEGVADVVRMYLAIHVRLAHASRDQLRDLRAEVEDQDLVVHGSEAASADAAWRARLKWRKAITMAVACSAAQR